MLVLHRIKVSMNLLLLLLLVEFLALFFLQHQDRQGCGQLPVLLDLFFLGHERLVGIGIAVVAMVVGSFSGLETNPAGTQREILVVVVAVGSYGIRGKDLESTDGATQGGFLSQAFVQGRLRRIRRHDGFRVAVLVVGQRRYRGQRGRHGLIGRGRNQRRVAGGVGQKGRRGRRRGSAGMFRSEMRVWDGWHGGGCWERGMGR